MLRNPCVRWSRLATVIALSGCVIGASCATPAAPPAPVSEPGAESMDSPNVEVRSAQEQADIVEKLKFDTEFLKEDVKQARLFDAECPGPRIAAGTIKGHIQSKYARVRAEVTRVAPSITDPQCARELKEGVLDPLDELAKSPYTAQR